MREENLTMAMKECASENGSALTGFSTFVTPNNPLIQLPLMVPSGKSSFSND